MADIAEPFSDPIVSISTEASASLLDSSVVSVVTEPSRSHDRAPKRDSATRQKSKALARPVSKKDRPLSSLIWSNDYLSSPTNLHSYDPSLERRMRQGVTISSAALPQWHLDTGAREPGTVNSLRDRPLPLELEDYRKRKQALVKTVTRSPLLAFVDFSGRSGMDCLLVYHNAIRFELFSLYAISSSIEKRALDVNENDAMSFYSWLGLFGDLIRLYFCASERFLFSVVEDTCDMELREVLIRKERSQAKVQIVSELESLEGLKRRMEATPEKCKEVVPLLSNMVDTFSLNLLKYLDAEIEQIPAVLTSYFHEERINEMFKNIDNYILESTNGSLLHVLLSLGARRSAQDQKRWIRQHIHRVYRHKTKLQTSIVAQRSLQRFNDTHQRHVRGFMKAESEYAKIFS